MIRVRDISGGIQRFNMILEEEARHNAILIDLFPLSQTLPESVYENSLRPNEQGYRAWEELVFATVKPLLEKP